MLLLESYRLSCRASRWPMGLPRRGKWEASCDAGSLDQVRLQAPEPPVGNPTEDKTEQALQDPGGDSCEP